MQGVQGFCLSLGDRRDVSAAGKCPESDEIATGVLQSYSLWCSVCGFLVEEQRSLGVWLVGVIKATWVSNLKMDS